MGIIKLTLSLVIFAFASRSQLTPGQSAVCAAIMLAGWIAHSDDYLLQPTSEKAKKETALDNKEVDDGK